MIKYQYFQPDNLGEVFELLSHHADKARLLAGGTDLMVQMKKGLKAPEVLVDITGIKELQNITIRKDLVEIGATVTHTELNENEDLKKLFPALAEAAGEVGSPQIRNQGTIAGNVGNGSPAADTVPVLYVLDAEAIIVNAAGTRRVKVWDLPVKPGKLALDANEVITGFVIPKPAVNEASAFVKVGRRKALAISVVNAAVTVKLDSEKKVIEKVRIALGSIAPTTRRFTEVEELLVGREVSEETLAFAQEKISELVKPITDLRGSQEYRKGLAGALVRKGLEKALAQLK